jgi:hypothetical protein
MSALNVMKAMMRIWPPQFGQISGNTSQIRAITAARSGEFGASTP